MQTARVLDPGEIQKGYFTSWTIHNWEKEGKEDIEQGSSEVTYFMRKGLQENLDGGISLSYIPIVGAGIYLDLKYQIVEEILNDPSIAVDIGGGLLATTGLKALISHSWFTGSFIVSKEIGSFDLFLGGKIIFIPTVDEDVTNMSAIYFGPFGGCKLNISSRWSLIGEASYFMGDNDDIWNFGIGFVYQPE